MDGLGRIRTIAQYRGKNFYRFRSCQMRTLSDHDSITNLEVKEFRSSPVKKEWQISENTGASLIWIKPGFIFFLSQLSF